jgi:hypothetical protein
MKVITLVISVFNASGTGLSPASHSNFVETEPVFVEAALDSCSVHAPLHDSSIAECSYGRGCLASHPTPRVEDHAFVIH